MRGEKGRVGVVGSIDGCGSESRFERLDGGLGFLNGDRHVVRWLDA